MRWGVFGDIHSNIEAFEAVHAAMKEKQVDDYICLGDIVGYGANPRECIALVREINPRIVAGNHDWAVVNKIDSDYFNLYAKEAVVWTGEQLSSDERKYLGNLPLTYANEVFTLCHSTIYQPEMFSYIQTSHDAQMSFEALKTSVGFVGHSHVPVTFIWQEYIAFTLENLIIVGPDEKAIVNVGSVGQPRDENPNAAYGVFDDEKRSIELFRVKYDISAAAKKIKDAKLPQILADRLYVGQ